MHKPKVVMTFFIGSGDPIKEEVGSVASCNAAPLLLLQAQMFSPKKGEYASTKWIGAD